jgi:serine/threonine-protein kinase
MSVSDRHDCAVDEELASKYEVFEVLGGGGMGRVLRARHRQLKRPVAIKLLQHGLKGSEAATRFLREARAAAQIRSPHVAQVMDAAVLSNGQPYIVMEYLAGQDLSQLIAARGPLPVEQAVDFLLQAMQAIAEAHSLAIVHRDLKPGNLFATRMAGDEIFIKVLDFGIAKTSQALDTLDTAVTETGAVLGTPSYMAPEQFIDAQDVEARADVWGLGATLFALVTGSPPFCGANLPQVYTAVMHRPIPLLRSVKPSLPEELEAVVARCLSRERDARYASVAELATALASFASADGSARESVDRIRRMLGAPRLSQPLAAETTAPSSEVHGAISLFAHETTGVPAPADSSGARPRRIAMWGMVALCLLLMAAAGWATTRRSLTVAPTVPRVATAPVTVTATEPVEPPAVKPPLTAPPPLAAPPAVTAATPRARSKPVRLAKPKLAAAPAPRPSGPSPAEKAPRSTIYERYP